MPMSKRWERVVKSLDVMAREANEAATGAESLDDKLEMQTLVKAVQDARRIMWAQYHRVEDADKHRAAYRKDREMYGCKRCGK